MSDDMIPSACPGCEPQREPRTYVVYWCEGHKPDNAGMDDRLVEQAAIYINGEGGESGRVWCDFIHRGKR